MVTAISASSTATRRAARYDVRYGKGTVFRFLLPAQLSLLTLGAWAVFCYLVILLGLRSKQTKQMIRSN